MSSDEVPIGRSPGVHVMSTSPLASASQHRPATQNTAPAILESVERARGRAYLAEFDLLRGAAIIAVVCFEIFRSRVSS